MNPTRKVLERKRRTKIRQIENCQVQLSEIERLLVARIEADRRDARERLQREDRALAEIGIAQADG